MFSEFFMIIYSFDDRGKAQMSSTTSKSEMNCTPKENYSTADSKNLPRANSNDCRYDIQCTREDCFYSHPNGRLIDQNNDTDITQKELSEYELIRLIEELLLKANENMNSKRTKEPRTPDDDEGDEVNYYSDQSDDEEPILDIVQNHAVKQFELQQNEFHSMIVSLQEEFDSLGDLDQENNYEQLRHLYERLQREMKHWETHLPIYSRRTDIVELIRKNQVSILKADTGSGKSTQVVQYLCDADFAQKSTQILFSIHRKLFFGFRTNPLYSAT